MASKKLCYSHLGTKKVLSTLDFDKTSYNDFVLARSEFLRLVEAPNKFLILVILYYMVTYTFGIKTTLLEPHRSQKKPFNGSISAKLGITT